MASPASREQRLPSAPRSVNLDAIEVLEEVDLRPPARAATMETIREERGLGRLHSVWYDLLFSDKSVSAVTTLHSYGYFVSIVMTLWGWPQFTEFGRTSTMVTKFMVQSLGFGASLLGVYACYSQQPNKLSLFFICELIHTVLVFFGLSYLFRTSRAELFSDYETVPFYNMKLVDYPFGVDKGVLDMSAEPAYEVSLLYFRAIYMLIVTSVFNVYTVYSVGRKLWSQSQPIPSEIQEQPGVPLQRIVGQSEDQGGEENEDRAPVEKQYTLLDKIGLLFGW